MLLNIEKNIRWIIIENLLSINLLLRNFLIPISRISTPKVAPVGNVMD